MAIGTYISIITLNVNGLSAPTKRHRLAEWIKNQYLPKIIPDISFQVSGWQMFVCTGFQPQNDISEG